MTYSAEQIPQRLPNLIWREVDEGTVIVAPEVGKVRVLNPVGTLIWEMIDGERNVASLATAVQKQFSQNIALGQLETDLQHFLSDLTERGLLTWS